MSRKSDAEKLLANLGERRAKTLVVSELLESLMGQWGGPSAFAKEVHTEFNASKAGGMIRARMISDVFRLFAIHTAGMKGPGDNLGAMSEAELKAVVADLMGGSDSDAGAAATQPTAAPL